MVKRFYFISVLVILVTILIGCAGETGFPGGEENKGELVTTSVISIPIEKIRTLNPLLSKDEDVYYLNKLIYDGLFVLNENLEAEVSLVQSFVYDENTGILTLNLLNNVLWQDGTPFTAADVKFTIDAFNSLAPNKAGIYATSVALIKSAKATDTHTVQIQFADPNNSALENLTFPILPSHKYNKVGDLIKDEKNFSPMGTGPYFISSLEDGKQIILSGNPNYRGIKPSNDLIFKNMPRKEYAVNLFDIGEINITFLKSTDRNTLVEDKVVKMVSFTSNEIEVLGFNFNHGALQNENVRRAIGYSIDKHDILETGYYNSGVINDSLYYPGYLGVKSNEDNTAKDSNEAINLLKESGNEGLVLDLVFNGENKGRNLSAQIIKSSLEKVGISVNLLSLTKEEYESKILKGEFDLYIGGFKINDNYDLRPILKTAGSLNFTNYSNTQMDQLLDKLQQCQEITDKRRIFQDISNIYSTQLPYICLVYKTYGLATSNGLEGSIRPSFNNIYNGCSDWKVTYEKPVVLESK